MNYLLISLISMVIVCVLIISTFFIKTAKAEDKLIPYVIILILIVLTYIYKIGEYPWGLHIDEAGAMYDGISIAKYGYDRYLNSFPVYFINYGGGQNALFTYVFAGWYKLLSLFVNIDLSTISINTSLFILRFPTVIYNLMAYLICFLIIRKEYGNKPALIGMIVFMATPFGLMHSRFSLESYYLFPTLLIAISLFIKGIRNHNSIAYAFSGLFFGLTLYTYAISYLIIPLLLIILLLIILYTRNFEIKNFISFIIPLILMVIPICLFFCVNYLDLPEFKFLGMTITKLPNFRIGEVSINNIKENLLSLNIVKRILFDRFDYNSFKDFSTIFYLNIPMALFGFWKSIKNFIDKLKNKEFCLDFIMLPLLIIIIIAGLLVANLNVNILNAIFIPLLYLTALGYIYISNKWKLIFRVLICILLINYTLFINMYYTRNQRVMGSWSNDLMEQIQLSNELGNDSTKYYYKIEYGMDKMYISLFSDINPTELQNYYNNHGEYIPEEHNDNDIYIIDDCYEETSILEKEGFKLIKNGRYNLYYK